MIYLDNAATTLIKPPSVARAMVNAAKMAASPGRGGHRPAMKAAEIVFSCRETAAKLFNVPEPERIVFTANATHALNIAINSLVKRGDRVLVSAYEHNSVTRPLEALGAEIIIADAPLFDTDAALQAFEHKIMDADMVICTHVSNVFGFILPVYEIADLCHKCKIPFILDASQSAGVLDVDYDKLGADFIAMPGHKALFGPQGTGILICGGQGKPLISGGSGSDSRSQLMPDYLPDRLEAGTHNVPGIAGLKAGMEFVMRVGRKNIEQYEQKMLYKLVQSLNGISGIEMFYGPPGTQSGVLSFRSPLMDCEEMAARLSRKGICLRSGLHCSPYAHRSAGTLESGTVRASLSPFVTLENTRNFSKILQNLFCVKA